MNWQGDAEIVKFLAEEIASEKQNQKPLTKLEGWEVNTIKGNIHKVQTQSLCIFKGTVHYSDVISSDL